MVTKFMGRIVIRSCFMWDLGLWCDAIFEYIFCLRSNCVKLAIRSFRMQAEGWDVIGLLWRCGLEILVQ